MGLGVKDGDLGSLRRPYRAPGSALGKPRAYALGYYLPPLRGSGGEWLPGEGRSVSDRIRIRHLRCLPHSGPYGFGNVAAASGPRPRFRKGFEQDALKLGPQAEACGSDGVYENTQGCGRTSVRPYKMLRNHV